MDKQLVTLMHQGALHLHLQLRVPRLLAPLSQQAVREIAAARNQARRHRASKMAIRCSRAKAAGAIGRLPSNHHRAVKVTPQAQPNKSRYSKFNSGSRDRARARLGRALRVQAMRPHALLLLPEEVEVVAGVVQVLVVV